MSQLVHGYCKQNIKSMTIIYLITNYYIDNPTFIWHCPTCTQNDVWCTTSQRNRCMVCGQY